MPAALPCSACSALLRLLSEWPLALARARARAASTPSLPPGGRGRGQAAAHGHRGAALPHQHGAAGGVGAVWALLQARGERPLSALAMGQPAGKRWRWLPAHLPGRPSPALPTNPQVHDNTERGELDLEDLPAGSLLDR